LFGTVLDLGGSLTPAIATWLNELGSNASAQQFWHEWRHRQRIEQYQDNIVAMGHSGYLAVAKSSCVYVAELLGVRADRSAIDRLMRAWQQLKLFDDVLPALSRLKGRFKLVALSNGERAFLDHLVKNRIRWDFDAVISVEEVGAFK